MRPGEEPITDDELLYRRIPASANPAWYDPVRNELNDQAFAPSKRDATGLSVWRAKYKSLEDAAEGSPGKSYYVAVLRASDLQQAGIAIDPRPDLPDGFDPAHAELTQLKSATRMDSKTLELQRELVRICGNNLVGPFHTPLS